MADLGAGGKIRIGAPNNIYTVLVIIATLFMCFGTVFLAVRSNQLFGTWLPFGPH